MNRPLSIAILAMLVAACSCSQNHTATRTLTERQRDSVISRSILPGASVVGRAMSQSDAETRRANRTDAMVDSLPH